METVAFYSYKGGVGRSNLLANAARLLAALGKGVVALDFDFEAPGLHYKLGGVFPNTSFDTSSPPHGAVPYLLATAQGAVTPPPIEEHMMSPAAPPRAGGWLKLMPAGPAPKQAYWAAFKELGERLDFGDPSGQGFMALLDLQARIAQELKPDYLLIDARTGITELGGLTTTVLSDTVVCMFVGNQESLDGTLAVVEALKSAHRLANQKSIRIVPVQSRMPFIGPVTEQYASGLTRLVDLIEATPAGTKDRTGIIPLPHDYALTDSENAGIRIPGAPSNQYRAALKRALETIFPDIAESSDGVIEILESSRWD